MRPRLHPLPLARNRDFMLLWTGDAVSELGSAMSMLVFPLVGYAISHSATQAGLATTGMLAGQTVARLPAGALVDRWPRGRVLFWTYLAGAATYGSLAVAAYAGVLTLAHLALVGFATGVVSAFAAPAASATVRTVVAPDDLPLAYSQLQARTHAAELIGPPTGGALYSVARGLPFLADAASYAVGAVCVLRLRTPLPAPPPTHRSLRHDVAEGLRFVWRTVPLRVAMVWGGLFNFAMTYVFIAVTLRLVRAGVHPAAIGAVDAIAAAAGLVGAFGAPAVLGRTRIGVLTVTTGLALALVIVPMAWTTNVVAVGALLALGMLFVPANNAGISAYVASVVPDHLQGRVNSASGFVATGLSPIAPVVAGAVLASTGGVTTTLVGAALVAASVLPIVASRSTRSLGRPGSWSRDVTLAVPTSPP